MKKVINWDDITLEQFIEVQTLEKDNDYSFNLISIVYDIQLRKLKIYQLKNSMSY